MTAESLDRCQWEACQVGCETTRDDTDILARRPPCDPSPAAFRCDVARIVRRVQEHVCASGSSCRAKPGQC